MRHNDGALEGDLNPAYISALAALAGATVGGMTSFATSWLTQRTQLRHAHREAERAELKTLYSDFITEASRLFETYLGPSADPWYHAARNKVPATAVVADQLLPYPDLQLR